ncbi:hypothetical protein M405DRAFT_845009 [Rhizopogon salebrosus TDB-379]|nr:hypothetical protein M405DRAFT_845009 [Rhizopogon salebrosus TDB-379]
MDKDYCNASVVTNPHVMIRKPEARNSDNHYRHDNFAVLYLLQILHFPVSCALGSRDSLFGGRISTALDAMHKRARGQEAGAGDAPRWFLGYTAAESRGPWWSLSDQIFSHRLSSLGMIKGIYDETSIPLSFLVMKPCCFQGRIKPPRQAFRPSDCGPDAGELHFTHLMFSQMPTTSLVFAHMFNISWRDICYIPLAGLSRVFPLSAVQRWSCQTALYPLSLTSVEWGASSGPACRVKWVERVQEDIHYGCIEFDSTFELVTFMLWFGIQVPFTNEKVREAQGPDDEMMEGEDEQEETNEEDELEGGDDAGTPLITEQFIVKETAGEMDEFGYTGLDQILVEDDDDELLPDEEEHNDELYNNHGLMLREVPANAPSQCSAW